MQYFMTASEQDAKVALEKAQLILKTRQSLTTAPQPVKVRTKRDRPVADIQLKEPSDA